MKTVPTLSPQFADILYFSVVHCGFVCPARQKAHLRLLFSALFVLHAHDLLTEHPALFLVAASRSLYRCQSRALPLFAVVPQTEQLWLLRYTSFRLLIAPHFRPRGTTETKLTACVKRFGILSCLFLFRCSPIASRCILLPLNCILSLLPNT